jgi:hypothetical protein
LHCITYFTTYYKWTPFSFITHIPFSGYEIHINQQ